VIDYIQHTRGFAQTACAVLSRHGQPEEAARLASAVEDKLGTLRPTLMFYGCYNAGKSSLINAIMGEDAARVSDRPQTDRVTSYPWRGYELLDTPGIDAPADHERVSEAQVARSDVVLFVVSSSGAFEERGVAEAMARVLALRKPLLVVMNNKSGLDLVSDEMMQARTRLLVNLGRLTGDPTCADRFTVHLVNARTALKARQEGKALLLERSGILGLERVLAETLAGMDGIRQLSTPLLLVDQQLARMVEHLDERLSEDDAAQPERLISRLREARNAAVGFARADLRGRLVPFEARVRAAVAAGSPLEPHLDGLQAAATGIVERRLGELVSSFDGILALPHGVKVGGPAAPKIDVVGAEPGAPNTKKSLIWDLTKNAANSSATEKVMLEGLKQLRSMGVKGIKGRWATTLGKWAGQGAKGLGVLVTAVTFVLDWRAADKAQREQEAAAMARQQAIAEQVRAFLSELEEQLLRAVEETFDSTLEPLLASLREQVLAGSREREALAGELRGVVDARASLAALRAELGGG
jgi:hypothetical protein